MLHHLERTRRLRGLFPYPDPNQHMLPHILTAYSQETAEVTNELKGWWAWWSDKPVNPDTLHEELADMMFFYLIYVMHAQDHQYGFDLERFTRLTEDGSTLRRTPYLMSPQHPAYRETVLGTLHRIQRDALAGVSRPYETLLRLNSGYGYLLSLLEVTEEQLERAYLKKFLVNITRTGKAHTPDGEALTLEVQQLLAELEVKAAARTAQRINQRMVA